MFSEIFKELGVGPEMAEIMSKITDDVIDKKRRTAVYGPRPIKRKRRTKADIAGLHAAIRHVLNDDAPMTVRQCFYRLVAVGAIEKTQAGYRTIVRALTMTRRTGLVQYDEITDNTRWMRKPRSWSDLPAWIDEARRVYRRALWDNQQVVLEVWCEKDAIAGVLLDVTAEYDVPLMPCRGYASETFLHSCAEDYKHQDRPVVIYYFGDYDPSGLGIGERVEQRLREFAPDADIEFIRSAVNHDQIGQWNLTTQPPKKGDTRAKGFKGECVELEAIPANTLRALCKECIEGHIDPAALEVTKEAERSERKVLTSLFDHLGDTGE